MKKKILITGGAGYIGYHVVKRLLSENQVQIVVLDSFLYENHSLDEFKDNKKLKVIKGDICNINDLVKAIKNIDTVIAFAAIVGDPACALNEEQTYASNYHSTELLVQLCNYYKIKRLIFASSCSVYGANDNILNEGSKLNPLSLYAKTRIMSEDIIKKNTNKELHWTILRFGTVFGWSKRIRFDLVVNFLVAKAFFSHEIDIIGGNQWRPFIHVKDIARAVVLVSLAKENLISKETFNVGDDRLNIKIKDIGKKIKRYIKKTKIIYKNIPPSDRRNYRVSFNKIASLLDFHSTYSIDNGILEIINNLKKNLTLNYLDDKYYNVKYLFKHFKK